MEKRTILAIVLSLFVLFAWSAVMPKPKRTVRPDSEFSQDTENKRDMDKSAMVEEVVAGSSDSSMSAPPAPVLADQSLETLSSEKIEAKVSNMGGNLKEISLAGFEEPVPLENIFNIDGYQEVAFKLQSRNQNKATYLLVHDGLQITKEYELVPDDYVVKAKIKITNLSEMSKLTDITIDGYHINSSSLDIKSSGRNSVLYEYSVLSGSSVHRKDNAVKFASKESKSEESPVDWVGFRNRYLCLFVKPLFDTTRYSIKYINDNLLKIQMGTNKQSLRSGESMSFESIIFLGPQEVGMLKEYGEKFEKIVIFSRFGLIDGIAKIMYKTIVFMHKIIPNWGVCIILISILFYGVTYPLTMRSMASMRKMQAIHPELSALKEKHKDNPQKLNQETIELYKKHKVNPFGGCLMVIIQMPMFFGLYQVLWRSVFFKGANFLWIKDLSMPDRLFILPFSIPFLGNEFNLLPLLMAIVMFFQQKATSRNMVVSDPAQAAQQKMMQRLLPVIMGAVFYKFASGLALFFTIFYTLSTITQFKMSKVTPTT